MDDSDKASALQPPAPNEGRGGNGNAASSSQGPRRPSPSPSRSAITPTGSLEPRDEYFEQLAPIPSSHSRRSAAQSDINLSSRPPSGYRNASRQPSIRLRRNSNASIRSQANSIASEGTPADEIATPSLAQYGRQRSASNPASSSSAGQVDARHSRRVPQIALPRLTEEGSRPTMEELGVNAAEAGRLSPPVSEPPEGIQDRGSSMETDGAPPQRRKRGMSLRLWPRRNSVDQAELPDARNSRQEEYDEQLVDFLDTVDPEIQALSTLTNIQNSLFIPDLGGLINRRPTYTLTQQERPGSRPPTGEPTEPHIAEIAQQEAELEAVEAQAGTSRMQRSDTITSRLTDSHYAALPHGATLEGWTDAEKRELDDHVRHMLHSRRAKFKRSMKGFGQYVRRPLGFFVTLYATLITLFGLAWVLFLIGWIYVGDKQEYTIHIIDSVLVGLFAIMGDGLAPFRAVDTYHLFFIVRYSRIMAKAKKKRLDEAKESMTDAQNTGKAVNSQPVDLETGPAEVETGDDEKHEERDLYPLNEKQRKSFLHHEKKMAKSHSFFKPEETFTHYSFPLSYLIGIVILLDCHSCLQISLGATTWGIDYHTRPIAITTVILCVSITCNITAGLVITAGDRKTRKKDVLKLIDRQELTSDAMKQVEKKRKKQDEQEKQHEDELKHEESGSSKTGSGLFKR